MRYEGVKMSSEDGRRSSTDVKTVSIKEMAEPGNIGPGLSVGFATLCVCFWANTMGLVNADGFGFSSGVVLLGFFVVYFVGGLYLLKVGDTFGGVVFVAFGASFGLFGGAVYLTGAICGVFGIPVDFTVAGISFVMSGLFLICVLPALRNASKVDFLIYLFAGIGVASLGLAGLGAAPEATSMIGGWSLLLSGIITYYSAVAGVLKASGITLPTGSPFFKKAD